jgi:hypothetical protein
MSGQAIEAVPRLSVDHPLPSKPFVVSVPSGLVMVRSTWGVPPESLHAAVPIRIATTTNFFDIVVTPENIRKNNQIAPRKLTKLYIGARPLRARDRQAGRFRSGPAVGTLHANTEPDRRDGGLCGFGESAFHKSEPGQRRA